MNSIRALNVRSRDDASPRYRPDRDLEHAGPVPSAYISPCRPADPPAGAEASDTSFAVKAASLP